LSISINLSANRLSLDLVDKIIKALDDQHIDHSLLEIELTERLKLEDMDNAITIIKTFRNNGIRIALDDFGTGYSSLTYLSKLDVSILKIDYDLISRIETDALIIVKTIIKIAYDYELDLIAEGVETERQLQILKELGCKTYQGFYFSKAVHPKDIDELVFNKRDTNNA